MVAASRARLGLYIFGRVSLFKNCYELQPTFKLLTQRPNDLHLILNETYPCSRKAGAAIRGKKLIMKNMSEMAEYVYKHFMNKIGELQEEFNAAQKLLEVPVEEPVQQMEVVQEKQEDLPFVPIPIQNEVDESILAVIAEKKLDSKDEETETELIPAADIDGDSEVVRKAPETIEVIDEGDTEMKDVQDTPVAPLTPVAPVTPVADEQMEQ